MKYLRIYSIALSAVALMVLAGCSDELDKSDYNYFPEGNSAILPTLTIAVSNPLGTTVDFTGTIDLASYPDSAILDKGCMCSPDSLFRFGVVAKSVDDVTDLSGIVDGLQGNTNYFARAYILTKDGVAYSSVVKFKTRLVRTMVNYTLDSLALKSDEYSTIDKDGDGFDWSWIYYDEEETQVIAMSNSYDDDAGPLEPENYLLFPAVEIPTGAAYATLSVTLEPLDPDWHAEVFKLIISENPITADNCQDAEELLVETLSDKEQVYSLNLPDSYIGKTVYISLCHYDCSNEYAIIFKGHKVTATF